MKNYFQIIKDFFHKENGNTLIGIFVLISFAIITIKIKNNYALKSIEDERLYTIGRISGFSKTKTTRFVKYIYSYNGKSFQSEKSYSNENHVIGERFLVVFNPNDNTNFLLPYKIDLNIEEPINGWKIPPNDIDENDIINYLKNKY